MRARHAIAGNGRGGRGSPGFGGRRQGAGGMGGRLSNMVVSFAFSAWMTVGVVEI